MSRHDLFLLLLIVVLVTAPFCMGQAAGSGPCAAPVFPKYGPDRNMFSAQQEDWLANIIDEQALSQLQKIEDPEGNYLQKMGERLLARLPPSELHYSFFIIDLPINNAFSVGGSRIYVTRQLIAFLKNDDELVGLLGHEIGHISSHQMPVNVTRVFRKVLGVEQVGDRSDIFQKWMQLQDVWGRKGVDLRGEVRAEDEQQIADRVAVYSMTRAGYQAAKFADFFDRLAENKGKTGNFFTDFFGATNPNTKRLRLLINQAAPLPQQCVTAREPGSQEHFLAWQKAVVSAARLAQKEQIAGVLHKSVLHPPLRGSLEYMQFSPDGRYLLAQDESSVFVLSRDPLTTLFSFEGTNADWAQFSADSRSVVLADAELRVQKWDIATRRRTFIQAVSVPGGCMESAVSDSGETLACVKRAKSDFEIELLDVRSGEVLFRKTMNWPVRLFAFSGTVQAELSHIRMQAGFQLQFSPDGRYFLLGTADSAFGYDVRNKSEMSLPGRVKQIINSNFTFMPNGSLAILNRQKPDRSSIVAFPSGDLVTEFPLEVNGLKLTGDLIAAAKGPYVLVTPAAMYPIAAIDIETKKLALGYRSPALAIYGDVVAGEQFGGRVALFSMADKKQLAGTQLPLSPLPPLRSASVSSDGKWLAAAGHTGGGVWNAESGERAMDTGTFSGGYFDKEGLLAIFDKLEQKPKMAGVNPEKKSREDLYDIESPVPVEGKKPDEELISKIGDVVIVSRSAKGRPTAEARDARTNQMRWKREYQTLVPRISYARAGKTLMAVFQFLGSAQSEGGRDPVLKPKLAGMPNQHDLVMVAILDPATGKTLDGIFIDTGRSFSIHAADSAGDTLVVNDSENRTQVYSLKSQQQRGKVLGRCVALSGQGDRMLVENEKGVADLYDTATLKSLVHYTFPSPIVHAEMPGAGGTLIVLTADQVVYRLDVSASQVPTPR